VVPLVEIIRLSGPTGRVFSAKCSRWSRLPATPVTLRSENSILDLIFLLLFFFINLFTFWQLLASERPGTLWDCLPELSRLRIASFHDKVGWGFLIKSCEPFVQGPSGNSGLMFFKTICWKNSLEISLLRTLEHGNLQFLGFSKVSSQQISSFFGKNYGRATHKVWSGKNRIAKGTIFVVAFEASTFAVAIREALGGHTHFWIEKIHFPKSIVYVAYESLWPQVVQVLQPLPDAQFGQNCLSAWSQRLRDATNTAVLWKLFFSNPKRLFPSKASRITTAKVHIPQGIINIVLLHGEESSKAPSLAISNVRFDVMLGSPVPLPLLLVENFRLSGPTGRVFSAKCSCRSRFFG